MINISDISFNLVTQVHYRQTAHFQHFIQANKYALEMLFSKYKVKPQNMLFFIFLYFSQERGNPRCLFVKCFLD